MTPRAFSNYTLTRFTLNKRNWTKHSEFRRQKYEGRGQKEEGRRQDGRRNGRLGVLRPFQAYRRVIRIAGAKVISGVIALRYIYIYCHHQPYIENKVGAFRWPSRALFGSRSRCRKPRTSFRVQKERRCQKISSSICRKWFERLPALAECAESLCF